MDTSDLQRFPVHPRQLQPVSLSALADDASSLAAAQQGLGDPTDTHTFQPFQPAIENLERQQQQQQHHLQNANHHTDTPVFIRPPRPGEPTNNLLITTPQYQTVSPSIPRQHRLSNSGGFEINHDEDILANRAGHPNVRNSSMVSQVRSTPEMRNAQLDMLQSGQEYNFALVTDIASKQEDYRKSMKLVPNPPDLDSWREKLFNVDETVTLSEEQYVFSSTLPTLVGRLVAYMNAR